MPPAIQVGGVRLMLSIVTLVMAVMAVMAVMLERYKI